MSTLVITKAYSDGSALTEAMVDNFKSGLEDLFNVNKFDADQFDPAMVLTSAKFGDSYLTVLDATPITFGTGGDASIGTDASKNLYFETLTTATEIQFIAGSYTLEFYTDKLYVPGDIIIGAGGANRTVLQALSIYKKPVLEWAGASYISIQANTSTSTETLIYFPTFIAAVDEALSTSAKYREAGILATANGYGVADVGAARGGRRSGVALTENSWYSVYAVKLRSGSDYDADTAKFILVFDTVLPYPTNEATLDGYYGTGCWLYMGLIRYGYGITGSSSSIIPFVYSNKGWCYFTNNDTGSSMGGLTLAQSTTDADDAPLYTLASGMTGAAIPDSVGHIQLALSRSKVSDWTIKDSTAQVLWRGGWQTEDTALTHGFVLELPFVTSATGYAINQVRKGTGAVDKRVCLAGFCDTLFTPRRQGHGV